MIVDSARDGESEWSEYVGESYKSSVLGKDDR